MTMTNEQIKEQHIKEMREMTEATVDNAIEAIHRNMTDEQILRIEEAILQRRRNILKYHTKS